MPESGRSGFKVKRPAGPPATRCPCSIADSRAEQFELVLEGEAADRGVIIRAADALNNIAVIGVLIAAPVGPIGLLTMQRTLERGLAGIIVSNTTLSRDGLRSPAAPASRRASTRVSISFCNASVSVTIRSS